MSEREHGASTGEGPWPNDDDDDAGQAMEDYISDMDRPLGSDDHTTAAEQREGDSIDERTRREQPQRERPDTSVDLVDDAGAEGADNEGSMTGDADATDGIVSPEQAAVHVVGDAPGGVDHPDDYVQD
ncbi:hypothetical protein BH18ACT17_BH18ACT17_16470 [soil metagenome]